MLQINENSYEKQLERIANSIMVKVREPNVFSSLSLKKRWGPENDSGIQMQPGRAIMSHTSDRNNNKDAGEQTSATIPGSYSNHTLVVADAESNATEQMASESVSLGPGEEEQKDKKKERHNKDGRVVQKRKHLDEDSRATREKIKCEPCKRLFDKKSAYLKHNRKHHHVQALTSPTPSADPPALTPYHDLPSPTPSDDLPSLTSCDDLPSIPTRHYFVKKGRCHCKHCFVEIAHPKYVQEHVKKHNKHFQCPVCQQYLASSKLLDVHKSITHGSIRWWRRGDVLGCPECSFRTESEVAIKKHLAIHGNPDVKSCQVCNRPFTKKRDLKEHLEIKHGSLQPIRLESEKNSIPAKWPRMSCIPDVARKITLVTDIRDFSKRPYRCAMCGFRTGDLTDLHFHVLIHLTGGAVK